MSAANKKFYTDVQIKSDILIDGATVNTVPVFDASKKIKSSIVSTTELEHLSGVTSNVQDQIDAAQVDATQALADAAAAQATADQVAADLLTEIANREQGDEDLLDIIDAHINAVSDAHAASAITNTPAGNLAATDVQSALDELQSDIDTRALDSAVIKKDGSVAFTAAQSMGGFKLTSLAAPTAASDAATKGYVDSALEGLKPKEAVRVATTAVGTLASDFENGDSVDGITLATGDRILIKDQAAPAENGIYVVQVSGAPVRSTDFDSVSPIDEINKAYVAVQEGSANAGKLYVQYGAVTTIGVDAINFTFFNSISGLIGGDGIAVSGSNISVDHDGEGLTFVAGQLAVELDGSTLSKSASGLKLSDTAVTPASLGSASETLSITVDQQGRLTAASEQAIAITASQVTDFNEAAQDAVGTIVTDSNTIDFTYNDVTPSIVADVRTQMSITSDASGIKLVNDNSTPGNSYYYGTDAAGVKGFFPVAAGAPGDIAETSFSPANNQVAAADVTGLVFSNAAVRSFQAIVSVYIDASSDLFENFELNGIQRGADWAMSIESEGDDSLIAFSITNAGQVQYTSANYAGFSLGEIKFRAITTSF